MSTKLLYERYIQNYQDNYDAALDKGEELDEELMDYDEFCEEYWDHNR